MKILRGPWNEDLFRVLDGFPDLAHDDEVDACSGALEMLNPNMKGYGAFEAARQRAEQLSPSTSATNRNPPNPHGPPAPWSGSPSRTNRAQPQLLRPSVCTSPRGPRAWRDSSAHPNRGTEGSRALSTFTVSF